MRRLLVALCVLALLVGALAVGDVLLRRAAETALAAAVEQRAPGTHGTTASIRSFPFVGRVVASGHVPEITVRAAETRLGDLPLRDVEVTVDDVVLDRQAALRGEARVVDAGRGRATAHVTQDDLSSRIPGVRVVLAPGGAEVVGPAGVKGQLDLARRGHLVVRLAGRSVLDLELARGGLLPCTPEARVDAGLLTLSCTFDEVPDVLLRAAGG